MTDLRRFCHFSKLSSNENPSFNLLLILDSELSAENILSASSDGLESKSIHTTESSTAIDLVAGEILDISREPQAQASKKLQLVT